MSVEIIIYYVNLNILPFAEKNISIAECKNKAYLYIEETPINKLLKFSVHLCLACSAPKEVP